MLSVIQTDLTGIAKSRECQKSNSLEGDPIRILLRILEGIIGNIQDCRIVTVQLAIFEWNSECVALSMSE
jgi:hypothetical protein